MLIRQIAGVSILAMFPVLATAESEAIYESLDEIHIGTIFYSPDERARIDGTSRSSVETKVKRSKTTVDSEKSAGYIVRSNGMARVYQDGDFIDAGITSATNDTTLSLAKKVFSNDVEVTGHQEVSISPKSRVNSHESEDASKP